LCSIVTRKEVPQKEGKKRITMGTALLLSGLFILLVLGFFVAVVYCLFITLYDTLAPDAPRQQRFLTASFLNFLTQLEE